MKSETHWNEDGKVVANGRVVRPRLLIGLEFQRRDCWIGAYWKREEIAPGFGWPRPCIWRTDVWVCIIPMLPIHIVKITPQER